MIFLKNFSRSLRHALAGIRYAFREERNFQIELILAIAALGLAFFFPLAVSERTALFLLIGLVLSLELVNTAFERLLEMLKPRVHPYVKVVKDVVAGSVLIGSVVALMVGIYIFFPYFWSVINFHS